MQVAQPYASQQKPFYPPYETASSFPPQSQFNQRMNVPQGYGAYSNIPPQNQPPYQDAGYPQHYLPQNRPGTVQHQRTQYINPGYQYGLDPRQYYTRDGRYNEQIQYRPLPTGQVRYPANSVPTHPSHLRPGNTFSTSTINKQIHQTVYEQQPLNIPQPVRNVQYIPHLNRYMDYVQERIKVPVEKYYTDYYEVEHVTDFVPREYEDTVIEMVPEEIVRYRLEYVPVERKIVHLPKNQVYDENGLFVGTGTLADRVHVAERPVGSENIAEEQINKALYDNLSNSQKHGLDESLVNVITKDMQGRSESNINKALYDNLRGQMSPTKTINKAIYESLKGQVSPTRNINKAIYQGLKGEFGSPTLPPTYNKPIYQALNKALGQSSSNPATQAINQQLYQQMSRNLPSQKTRGSRRRTNFVTSEGYFPNYEEEMRNMDSSRSGERYYNDGYGQRGDYSVEGSRMY